MKLKRLLVLALSALMVFGAVGCGGGPGPDTPDGPGDGAQTTIKVEYLLAGYGSKAFDEIAKAFMAKPENSDIKVTLVPNENVNGETGTKLQAGVASRLSDVYYGEFLGSVRRWTILGYVEPIDDVMAMNAPGEADLTNDANADGKVTVAENILPGSLESRKMVKGDETHYWSLPHNMSVSSFVYNKKLFDQYDLEIPTTTAELLDFCDTVMDMELVTDKGVPITPYTYCGAANDGYWGNILHTWWLQASGVEKLNTFSKYESPDIYADPGRLRMLEVFNDIAFNQTYHPANILSMDHTDAQTSFLKGEAFLLPCGSWFEREMEEWIQVYSKYCDPRMMSVPMICSQDGTPLSETQYLWEGASDAWFIPSIRSDAQKAAAKRFLAFVASDEVSAIWTKYAGGVRAYYYDTTPTSALYQELTTFQQSCCDVANQSTIYRLNTTSPLALQGYASTFPWQDSPFVALQEGMTPFDYWTGEQTYASSQWNQWKENVGLN